MSEPITDEVEIPKKEYQHPEFKIYGALADLTKEGGNVGDDGFSGSKARI